MLRVAVRVLASAAFIAFSDTFAFFSLNSSWPRRLPSELTLAQPTRASVFGRVFPSISSLVHSLCNMSPKSFAAGSTVHCNYTLNLESLRHRCIEWIPFTLPKHRIDLAKNRGHEPFWTNIFTLHIPNIRYGMACLRWFQESVCTYSSSMECFVFRHGFSFNQGTMEWRSSRMIRGTGPESNGIARPFRWTCVLLVTAAMAVVRLRST